METLKKQKRHSSKKKSEQSTAGVGVGDIGVPLPTSEQSATEPKTPRKLKILTLVALSVLVVLSVGWLVYSDRTNKLQDTKVATEPAEDTTDYSQITSSQYYQAEYDAKKNELSKAARDAKGPEKSKKLVELSLLALNSGNQQEALRLAKEAEKNNQIMLTADTLAVVYAGSGDYKLAAEWYGVAATRAQNSTDTLEQAIYKEYLAKQKQAERQIQ